MGDLQEPTFEDEYLDPEVKLLPSPSSLTSEDRMNFPLPPLPQDEIELDTFHALADPEAEEKQKFIVLDSPKKKRSDRVDSELEKVRKDTLEREKDGREGSFFSDKEQLRSYDEDRDICERNSGVFDLPIAPEPSNAHTLEVPPQETGYYDDKRPPPQEGVQCKTGNGFLSRQLSNRYVNS